MAEVGKSLSNIRNWSLFSARTAFYGTVSCVGGPLTPGRAASRWAMRNWSRGSLDSMGIGVEFVNGERIEPNRQCVYVANHLSVLDILVIGAVLESDYRWLAKAPLFWIPFLGWHLHLSGHIPVYRGRAKERNRSVPERMADVIAEGASLLFFPEGTRSESGKLKDFKLGAFRAAVDMDLPVVPLVLEGTADLMRKGARGLSRVDRHCTITVGETFEPVPDRKGKEGAVELRDLVHAYFAESLGE